MYTRVIRSMITAAPVLLAALLLWLIAAFAANSPAIVQAVPEGGVVGTGTPASCTEAALDAKLSGGGNISFSCGANPYTLTISNSKTISVNTTIDGGGLITLSGGDAVKVFFVNPGVRLTLNNLTVAHGNSPLGGCVTVQGTLNATQSTFRNCTSHSFSFFAGAGGAIYSLNGTVALTDSIVMNNSVDLNGGGIFLSGGQGTLNHVNVLNNTAWLTYTGSGGGVALGANTNFVASNSSFSYNGIGYTGQGGGLYVFSSTALLVNVAANYNQALNAADGGGFYAENSQFTLQGGSANGNSGLYDGGGLTLHNSVANISNATINGNTASSNGGGINAYQGSLSMNNVSVDHNSVRSDGGGIDLYQTPTTLVNVTVNNNHGERSGGGIHNYWETLTLDRVTVSGNEATGNQGDGGGVLNDRGVLIASNSTIDHNTTTGHGGGIYNDTNSIVDLTNVTLSANTAAIDGGGIHNEASFSTDVTTISMTNVTLKDNQADNGAGVFNGNTVFNFVYLKNTIIADSSGHNCAGKVFTSARYSLSSDTTCNLVGTGNLNNVKAQLFPLLNNGGATRTHLPAPASPVVNGVSGTDFPSTDQRGVARPQGLGADMGAVERQLSDPVIAPWVYLPLALR